MPLTRCQKDGKRGWRWGGAKSGATCYTGQDAKAKAERQGRAIEASKRRRK